MDKRRRDLSSVQRFAEWLTFVENEGEWLSRETGQRIGRGPVVELELGYRGAAYFLPADRYPTTGSWWFLTDSILSS